MNKRTIIRLIKKPRRFWRGLGRKRRQRLGLVAACILIAIIVTQGLKPTMIAPTAYRPLLEIIAKGESNGNYNAYFGQVGKAPVRFTEMSIGEVMQWQRDYLNQGSASNAVGRYQFMGTTLAGLVRQLGINPATQFNEALQDRLAIALIERRGAVAYVEKKITREQFAQNLSMEWAALPRVTGDNPHESYYAGDGLNHARISIGDVLQAIGLLAQ